MSDGAGTPAPDTALAPVEDPAGMALLGDKVQEDYSAEMAAMMADVNPAVLEAMGLGEPPAPEKPAGVDPKLQPDSQSLPGQGKEAQKTQASNVTMAAVGVAAMSAFAMRVRKKRAANVSSAMQTMFKTTIAYQHSANAYNLMARKKAPELFKEVAEMARRTGKSEREVLAAVVNTNIKNPELDGLRKGMKTLADDPDLIHRRQEMRQLARQFENRSNQVSKWVARVEAGVTPANGTQVTNAVSSLRKVLDTNITPKVKNLPELDVNTPSAKPDGSIDRFKAGLGDLVGKIEEFVQRFTASVGRALGRG